MQQAVKHDPGYNLLYKSNTSFKIQAFFDSDWTTCATNYLYILLIIIIIYIYILLIIIIIYIFIYIINKKQTTVSQSSSKAEYRALASLACELQ